MKSETVRVDLDFEASKGEEAEEEEETEEKEEEEEEEKRSQKDELRTKCWFVLIDSFLIITLDMATQIMVTQFASDLK